MAYSNDSDFDGFDEDSYDPEFFDEDNYDPEFYTKDKRKNGVKRLASTTATFDIAIKNPTALNLYVDLFNFNYGFHNVLNSQYQTYAKAQTATNAYAARFDYVPSGSLEGSIAFANYNATTPSTSIAQGEVIWDQLGNLLVGGGKSDPYLSICGGTIPYRSIMAASYQSPFQINKIKITVTNQSQLDQIITHSERTFLGGVKQNTVNPRSEFGINQFQPNMAEIKRPFLIDGEKGLSWLILANNTVTMNFTVSRITKLSAR